MEEDGISSFIVRAIAFVLFIFALAAIGLVVGCASDRYLTAEQDEEFRQACQQDGCTVIPNPQWLQIEQILRRLVGS